MSAIRNIRFDERLVLYAWQEDRDFGAQIMKAGGIIAKINTAIGVHLGVKNGRVSGRKLGYSQVVNPVYLCAKGTMTHGVAAQLIAGNVISNLFRSLVSEPWVDRPGRLLGNWLALRDLTRRRLTPERAEHL